MPRSFLVKTKEREESESDNDTSDCSQTTFHSTSPRTWRENDVTTSTALWYSHLSPPCHGLPLLNARTPMLPFVDFFHLSPSFPSANGWYSETRKQEMSFVFCNSGRLHENIVKWKETCPFCSKKVAFWFLWFFFLHFPWKQENFL